MENDNLNNDFVKYDKLISDYFNLARKHGFPDMKKERKQYDFTLKRLYCFYFVANYISSLKIKSEKPCQNALFTIMSKASSDLLGIYHCLVNGLENQAGILFRSLYETYVYDSFIFKEDTEARIELFYNFQFIQRGYHLIKQNKADQNYVKKMGFSPKEVDDYEKTYNKFIKDYNSKSPHHWAYKIFKDRITKPNPSLLDICKDLGNDFIVEYNSVYGTSSIQSHPSSILGDYFTIEEGQKSIMVNSPMYKDSIINVSAVTVDYCGRIVLNFIKYFEVKDAKGLTDYIKHYIDRTVNEGLDFFKNR